MTYANLLAQSSRLAGRATLPDSESAMFLGFIASSLTWAWDFAAWPDLAATEAVGVDVTTAGTWSLDTTYAADDVVSYDGDYYKSLAGSNTGYEPTDHADKWVLVSPFRSISRTSDLSAEVGQCPGIYLDDPAETSQPTAVRFWEEGDDLVLEDDAYQVWVDYLEPAPALLTLTETELAAITIPDRLASAISYRAAGHMLRADGLAETGDEFLVMAEQELASRLERVKWPARWIQHETRR